MIDCSEFAGLLANHVLLRYVLDDVFVEISVHNHTEGNRQLVIEIADTIEMVHPD